MKIEFTEQEITDYISDNHKNDVPLLYNIVQESTSTWDSLAAVVDDLIDTMALHGALSYLSEDTINRIKG